MQVNGILVKQGFPKKVAGSTEPNPIWIFYMPDALLITR